MLFTERKEFLYDSEIFKRDDTQTALKIHAEYVRRHSAIPNPKFFEVDRANENIDSLWHMPLTPRTLFSREILMPAIVTFSKPDWRLTRMGIVPQRQDKFWCAHDILQELDYFPMRGDMVYYNGYRLMIVNVVIPEKAYWMQHNVWLGLVCECIIPPHGDAPPVINPGITIPAERKGL